MEFEFAKYTEITDLAFELNPDYKKEGYVRFFICPDVWDIWFVRILKGYRNDDEEGYVKDGNNFILERNNINKRSKTDTLTLSMVKRIIKEDSGDSYDLEQCDDLEELVDMLDDGFGIINRK